jgi:long-chain acyl-CoA synthetase
MSGHKRNGAGGAHPGHAGSSPRPTGPLSPETAGGQGEGPGTSRALDVRSTLAGRTLLFTGATGFVGKVALTMLLDRYPQIGKVFVLVRPGTGGSAEARFFEKVAMSRPFDPLRQRHGDRFDAFLRERCVPLAGDVSDPLLGLSDADLGRLGRLDAVVNCAGLVDFDPSLELALGVNVRGPRNAVELCRRTGAALLHVSTCFVAGNRDGMVYEDEELDGYFPRREGVSGRPKESPLDGADFDLEAEIADCERRMAEVRERAEDRVQQSLFRDRALERLAEDGRKGDEKALRLAIAREKRVWLSQRLVEIGMERARHWGWPNTYTYTKSLGEQAISATLRAPAGDRIHWSIVRPSIVESALRHPFPGWNEGFTTSAPLTFLALKGHRGFPAAEKAILDVVPVDLVAAATLAATAELVERNAANRPAAGRIYHLASGDTNPLWARRAVELTALYRRRHLRERETGNATWNRLVARIEPYAASRAQYEAFGAPAIAALSRLARRALEEATPRWGAPRLSALAERARRELDELDDRLAKLTKLWDLFLPFVWDNKYVFRCAHIRELYGRLSPADRAALPWDPEALDWRGYWLRVHMKGLEEWVFPGFEEASGKRVHAPRTHRDLLELLESACEQWGRRTALRMEGERKDRITYAELRRMACAVAGSLAAAGVAKGDRVLLASENRPEWAVAYFGILRAGAAAVPVDPLLSAPELANLWRSAGARIAIVSDDTARRHPELGALAAAAIPGARVAFLAEVLGGGPPPPPPRFSGDDLASLIFTSGTTGAPKGVMLSHRNFASLAGKLSGLFELGPGDGLLSVLPLHHTFEFTAGLLVPLSRGAEIEYLDELTADRISEALGAGRVTAMIGVPALWSLLHRRITQELAAKPGVLEGAFRALMKGNAALRDSAVALNLGKLLFWPVHRKFGGRLRLLVSGGSALDPEVQQAFRELGFDLYEGYGLTEAAPVLAVSSPGGDAPPGSVGPALPGVELRIESPDADGVGEVLARGPNVMLGYWRGGASPGVDPELTGEALEDGWLRTGDLGRLDANGNLTLVGRKKDVIIDANGKNVYPDEIEDAYRDPDLVKELCVVGLPDGAKGEKVAMLVVPDWRDRDRGEVREKLEAHVRAVSAKLPFPKRAKVWHVVDGELPKTATRKVKRPLVREELLRIEAMAQKGRKARAEAQGRAGGDGWLLDLLAEVSRRPRAEIGPETRLQADLGFDSLMVTELAAALEEAGVPATIADRLQGIHTVGELSRAVAGAGRRAVGERDPSAAEEAAAAAGGEELHVPALLARLGRRVLDVGQRALYEVVYDTKVQGAAFIPHDRSFLVVANHASHLDMGLVKVALGDEGRRVAALAARDYFFDTPLKRAYFENFTNLIPMEREGSLRTSLRAAAEALRRGYHLLIFPEGTRSRDGSMAPFYPTAGYLALHCGVDVLPAYLAGTHEALPPGRTVPRKHALEVRFGPAIPVAELRRLTVGMSRGEAYRAATAVMERAVKVLRDGTAAPTATATAASTPTATSTSTPTPTPTATSTATSTSTSTPTATSTATSTSNGGAAPGSFTLKPPERE